jgi:hypothetical protein
LKIEFAPTVEEYLEATRVAQRLLRGAESTIGIPLSLAGGLLMFCSSIYLAIHQNALWGAGAVLGGTYLLIFVKVCAERTSGGRRRAFLADDRATDWIIFEPDTTGFLLRGQLSSYRVEWAVVREVASSDSVFVILDDQPQAFLIPKRALAGLGQNEEFLSTIRQAGVHLSEVAR